MKNISILIVALHICFKVSCQSYFQLDPVSKSVLNIQSFKLSPKVKADDVYDLAQTWFNVPQKFTCKNADPPMDSLKAKRNKKKLEVDKQFDNSKPLQMLNPSAGKIIGSGVLKYYGGGGNSIKLLYLKYDIYIEIKSGLATVSASNIRYYHFSPQNYATTGLYGFGGGKPCEGEGTIEELIACENFHDEFKGLALCFNKEVNNLFSDFKNLLSQKKVLYVAMAATGKSTTRVPAKTAKKR